MELVAGYSRRMLLIIVLVMSLLLLLVDLSFYYGMDAMFSNITVTGRTGADVSIIVGLSQNIAMLQKQLRMYFVPISAVVFASAAFFLWLFLRASLVNLSKTKGSARLSPVDGQSEKGPIMDPRVKLETDSRLFLHLLSVLQREGRLVDFFSENLGLYDDQQIGAAVRSIHENCKQALRKYVSFSAVMEYNEGDEVTVPASFNPNAIKLTGNVTGEPPFKGVLRHRGWMASDIELPTLAPGEGYRIIAPAEVEIA
ncbi:MAG: DUF2760 domain-containing protein [Thermodesulfobacteriota bacterium]